MISTRVIWYMPLLANRRIAGPGHQLNGKLALFAQLLKENYSGRVVLPRSVVLSPTDHVSPSSDHSSPREPGRDLQHKHYQVILARLL